MWDSLHAFTQQVIIGVIIPFLSLVLLGTLTSLMKWYAQKIKQEWVYTEWRTYVEQITRLVWAAEQHPDLAGASNGPRKKEWVLDQVARLLGYSSWEAVPDTIDKARVDSTIEAAVYKLNKEQGKEPSGAGQVNKIGFHPKRSPQDK